MKSYPVLDPVSRAYPRVQGRLPTCYSPVRRSCTPKGLTARLACVKHAASVRPEPGSNSPTKTGPKKPNPTDQARGRRANIKLAQHANSEKKLDTLLSSQKTPAHRTRIIRWLIGAFVLTSRVAPRPCRGQLPYVRWSG